ncbi:MAG: DUF6125 family protein [Anaerolineales bacterium]|jgi:hypothetical protein
MNLDSLSRDELIRLVQVYAKNWLAHDGCWFLAVEEKFGLETAMQLDNRAWEQFSPVEARRIMEAFGLPAAGGLESLERALDRRLYATVNRQETRRVSVDILRFRMVDCRVQHARQKKGLAPFPCKEVGVTEYSLFAQAVDPRIITRCLQAPPDRIGDCYCEWEFRLEEAPSMAGKAAPPAR